MKKASKRKRAAGTAVKKQASAQTANAAQTAEGSLPAAQTVTPVPPAEKPAAEQDNEKQAPAQNGQDTAEAQQMPAKEGQQPAQAEQKPAKAKKQRSPMTPVQLFLLNAVIIVTAVWLLFGFVFGLTSAPNADMSPNIKANDLLLYYRLDRGCRAQDVVVLKKNGTTYVGRVVACGGDTVDITDDSQLIINGNAMVENNIYTATPRYEGFAEYPLTLGEGEYFVLADHRSGGEDSRYYGSVSEREILGKVITVLRRSNL